MKCTFTNSRINISVSLFILFLITLSYCYNTSTNLNSSRKNSKKSEFYPQSLSTKQICDGGFDFPGVCISDIKLLLEKQVPSSIHPTWEKMIQPILKASPVQVDSCVGDFTGIILSKNSEKISNFFCHEIPYDSRFNYGTLGLNINHFTCTDRDTDKQVPTDLKFCFTFDKCGTVGIVINGAGIKCLPKTSGLGSILNTAAKFINHVTFAMSPQRKISQQLEIAQFKGREFLCKSVNTQGHFFLGLGLKIPNDFMKINEKNFGEIVIVEDDSLVQVDFAKAKSVVNGLVTDIQNGNAGNMASRIISLGKELVIKAKGIVKFNLSEISYGFLPDINFNTAALNLLVTQGKGKSKMRQGVYVKFDHEKISNIIEMVKSVYSHYQGILTVISKEISANHVIEEIEKINLKNLIGALSITNSYIAFEFKNENLTIRCAYNFSLKNSSCKFGEISFTAVLKSGKWNIKPARRLFSVKKKTVIKVDANKEKFSQSSNEEALKIIEKKSEIMKRNAEEAAKEMKSISSMSTEQAADLVKKIAKESVMQAKKDAESEKFDARKTRKSLKRNGRINKKPVITV
jgi:hypothetical protein